MVLFTVLLLYHHHLMKNKTYIKLKKLVSLGFKGVRPKSRGLYYAAHWCLSSVFYWTLSQPVVCFVRIVFTSIYSSIWFLS